MRNLPKAAVCTMAENASSGRNCLPATCRERRLLSGNAKGVSAIMKRRVWLFILLFVALSARPSAAQGLGGLLSNLGSTLSNLTSPQPGVIVRTNLGLAGLKTVCLLHGCTVAGNLDGNLNQVFLVRPAKGLLPNLLASVLNLVTGILDAEPDQTFQIPPDPTSQHTSNAPPAGLWDTTPVNYYGTTVTDGYVNQPAAQIIQISQAQSVFNVTGSGIVADIDTGVDPNHPAFQGVLAAGLRFHAQSTGRVRNERRFDERPAAVRFLPGRLREPTHGCNARSAHRAHARRHIL